MITTSSLVEEYRATASNGRVEVPIDAPAGKGGQGAGFGAHELLEAALAACLNMAVRMHARKEGIPLDGVRTSVRIERPDEGTVRFVQEIHFDGDLREEHRAALLHAAAVCPVRQTLSRRIEFAGIEA